MTNVSDLPGLVPFLFGVAGRDALPGPVLVRLLVEAGFTAPSARTGLTRMRERGGLAAERAGRHVEYRLAGATLSAFRRLRDRPAEPEWDGTFHGVLFTVPETARAHRDLLRRIMVLSGYGPLRAGLWISPRDGWPALSAQLGPPPSGARIAPVELRLAPADAREAAAEAWDLAAAATALQAQEQRIRAVRPTTHADGATLRTYHELVRPVFETLLRIPTLPAPLLPADWPRGALLAALGETIGHFQPAAGAYVRSLLDGY
jgi:phenylacetic acid degradation operon negative regulatory protein